MQTQMSQSLLSVFVKSELLFFKMLLKIPKRLKWRTVEATEKENSPHKKKTSFHSIGSFAHKRESYKNWNWFFFSINILKCLKILQRIAHYILTLKKRFKIDSLQFRWRAADFHPHVRSPASTQRCCRQIQLEHLEEAVRRRDSPGREVTSAARAGRITCSALVCERNIMFIVLPVRDKGSEVICFFGIKWVQRNVTDMYWIQINPLQLLNQHSSTSRWSQLLLFTPSNQNCLGGVKLDGKRRGPRTPTTETKRMK